MKIEHHKHRNGNIQETEILEKSKRNPGVKGATGRRKKAKLKEEQWILRHLMDTDKELQQVKAERERLSQDLCKARTELEEMKLWALCAKKDAELQKKHAEMEKAVKQIFCFSYELEQKPASSTWQKVFLVMVGAMLCVAGAILMGFCPIEVEGEISYFE